MSRHRDFKGHNFDYSDDDSHSSNVTDDENYGTSPNTAALYMYDEKKSGNSRVISNYLSCKSLNINEDCFPDHEDVVKLHEENPIIIKPIEKKETKVFSIPKVDSSSKISSLKAGDKSAVITQEKINVPYDPSLILNIYKQYKPDSFNKQLINLITIGHVDAGKSTLMGNLLFQMNYVSGRKLTKFKHEAQKAGKASFLFAWILDESVEERSRGITTDVAQTYFETESRKIRLLDAPGHKDFIPNMITGATQADAALLVVNATKGEFETGFDLGGQTREHALLIRMLGISDIIIAVNKMDTVNWSQDRFEEICEKVKKFLKSLKINGKFCPVSGLLGTNLTDNNADNNTSYLVSKVMPWYKGPKLIDLIDELDCPIRFLDKPLRINVTDVYKPQGSGIYQVAGRIEAGGLSTDIPNLSRVLCMPGGIVATVKSIKISSNVSDESGTCSEIPVPCAFDGDQIIMQISGIDLNLSLEIGSILCNPDYPVGYTNRIRAKILILELKNSGVITRGYKGIFYYKRIDVPVKFKKLHSILIREGKREVEKLKPRYLTESCSAEVDLELDKPICIETYQNFKNLGKFTIRESGNTIAGGTVLKLLKSKQ